MNKLFLAWGIGFAVTAILVPILIPILHRLKFGQQIREVGPAGHKKKAGTPIMGGLAFMAATTIAALIFLPQNKEILPILLVSWGYGLIGVADDALIIIRKKNDGLKPRFKLLLQIAVTVLFIWYRLAKVPDATVIRLPFTQVTWNMPVWLYIVLLFFLCLGTDNAVNLNDGLDGLCGSVTMVVALFVTALSLKYGAGIELFSAALSGALLGYLLYNSNPAMIFMGDTGSLYLGGFVAASFVTLAQPFMILIAGFIYFAEIVSVMMQVSYFRLTHGKRIFRMTPIHHHFELGGWSEPRVVIVFSAITVCLCIVSYLGA